MTVWRSLVLLGVLLWCLPLAAQFSGMPGGVTLKDFTVSGFDERGQSWHLSGHRTETSGTMVVVEDFNLRFVLRQGESAEGGKEGSRSILKADEKGQVNVVLRSDTCELNTVTHEIKSDAAVHIALGSNVRLTGIGYDVDVSHKVILLRSHVAVHLKINHRSLDVQRHQRKSK